MSLFEKFEITGKTTGPHLLITGGVHGDEYEGIEAVRRLMKEMDPAELGGTLTLIPIVNLSAHLLDARCGEDHLDLARTCPGRIDGTTTEQVAAELTWQIQKADLYIDLHTGGKAMQLHPLVGYQLVSDKTVLEKQRRMARAFGLPIIWGTCGDLDGRSLSVARDAGVPAVYAEYLGGENCSPEGVEAYVSGCRNIMAEFRMLPHETPRFFEAEWEIEDERPNSGHLQIHHPCPQDGVFQPGLRLGQEVKEGDELGRVGNVVVSAENGGRVICLHLVGEVKTGECLGVILEKS